MPAPSSTASGNPFVDPAAIKAAATPTENGSPDIDVKAPANTPLSAPFTATPAVNLDNSGSSAAVAPTKVSQTPPPVTTPQGQTPADLLTAHVASTSPTNNGTKTSGSSDTSGFTSSSDQTAIFNNMNSGNTDLSSSGSALSSFSDAATAATDPVTAQIESNLQALMTQATTPPPSFLTMYNNLINSSGIQADQLSELNLETMMSGTVNDIRQELTAHGGFATESQIQALASTRNQALQSQLTALQNSDSLKQSWIDAQMKYSDEDYTNTEANFEKNFQLQNTLLSTLQRAQTAQATADYRFQNQQMSQLKFLVDSGGLANASPAVLASYAATTGMDIGSIQQAAQDGASKVALSQELQAALLNNRLGGGTAGVRSSRVAGYLQSQAGTDGLVNANSYSTALQQFSAGGGTAANFLVQFPPDQYLNRDQIEALPSDVPEFETVKFNADLTDFVGAVQAGSLDSAKAENTLIANYPDQATKIKDAFSALQ